MKIKEELIEKIKMQSEDDVSNYIFTKFMISITAIILAEVMDTLALDMPDVLINDQEIDGSRKTENEIKAEDMFKVLSGEDFLDRSSFTIRLKSFSSGSLSRKIHIIKVAKVGIMDGTTRTQSARCGTNLSILRVLKIKIKCCLKSIINC